MQDLSMREPELCVKALDALLDMLQALPADTLASEPYAFMRRLFDLLKELRSNSKDLNLARQTQ